LIFKDILMWKLCLTVWIDCLYLQIWDMDAKYEKFCALRITIISLSIYIHTLTCLFNNCDSGTSDKAVMKMKENYIHTVYSSDMSCIKCNSTAAGIIRGTSSGGMWCLALVSLLSPELSGAFHQPPRCVRVRWCTKE
jgi:hypothetical protein